MFPIPHDRRLPLSLIADYWSREAQPAATKRETVTELIQAWWRGELVGSNGPSRLKMLQSLFRRCQDHVAFMAPGVEAPPQIEPTDDGGARVIRPIAVPLPNCEPDSWTDMNCAPAYDALAEGWHWLESDIAEPSICGTELTRAEFFEWLATRGRWLPAFWGASSLSERMVNTAQRLALDQDRTADGRSRAGEREGVARLFDSRLGWISLTQAIELGKADAGDSAWEQMILAIRHSRLPARGLADGVTKDFEPTWLDFLAWDHPESRDVLWFDKEKASRKGACVPSRVENIVVELARISELWPGCAAGNADASYVLDATREAAPASAPPSEMRASGGMGFWTLCETLTWIAWGQPFNSMELRAADGVIPGSGDLHARIAAVRKSEVYSTKVVMAEMEEAARELWRHIAECDVEAIGRPAWGVGTELKRIDPYWFLETPPPKALYLFDQICAGE